MINYDKAKDQIITEMYSSRELKNKIRKICFNNGYTEKSGFLEDVFHQVIEALLKYEAQKLYEIYVKNPNVIIGLGVTIAKRSFMSHPDYPDYPKHSFMKNNAYISTYNTLQSVSPTDNERENESGDLELVMIDFTTVEREPSTLQKIYHYLDKEEIEFLETEMDMIGFTKRGRPKKEYQEFKDRLFDKIRDIVDNEDIYL